MAHTPPLRVTAADGSYNQIPVFEMQISGGVLTQLSPSRMELGISGSQGPSGPPGATIVYAPTGGPYITFVANDTLSAEKLLTASDNITINTGDTVVGIAATTSDISGLQPTITYPLAINSGGIGFATAGSATALAGMHSSDNTRYDYYQLDGGNSITITRTGTSYSIAATTQDITGLQPTITYPLAINSGGIGIADAGSATALVGMHSSDTTRFDYYQLDAGNSVTLARTGTSYSIAATTQNITDLVAQGTTLTAGSGLSGGGDLSADRVFSVNTNVRDKASAFFGAGNLTGGKDFEKARIFIPFNMEVRDIRGAVATSSVGASIDITVNQYGTPDANPTVVGSAVFAATEFVASNNATFTTDTLYTGSWIGIAVSKSGSTVAGSNLTLTLLTRTS